MEITDLEIETEAQHNRKAKYIVKSKHTDEELYEKVNSIYVSRMFHTLCQFFCIINLFKDRSSNTCSYYTWRIICKYIRGLNSFNCDIRRQYPNNESLSVLDSKSGNAYGTNGKIIEWNCIFDNCYYSDQFKRIEIK